MRHYTAPNSVQILPSATKIIRVIRCLEPDVNRRVFGFEILVNTWSTFCEATIYGADNRRRTLQSCRLPSYRFKPNPDFRSDLREQRAPEWVNSGSGQEMWWGLREQLAGGF